jgi:hypothetical protein
VGPQCDTGMEWFELFVYYGPVRTKLKWFVPINEHTLQTVYVPLVVIGEQAKHICGESQAPNCPINSNIAFLIF